MQQRHRAPHDMGLFSFLKRGERSRPAEAAAAPSRSEVDQLRTRARRRLVGAMVLVVAAVVGFPLLFETQPRPLRADLPIQTVPRDAAVVVAPAPAPTRVADPASVPARNDTPPDSRPDEVAGAASVPAAAASAASATAVAAPQPEPKPEPKPTPPAAPRPAGDAARAQAAVEGRDRPAKPAERPAPPSASRFVVQVGAFAEADAARDVRGRVERLGLRTYTQEVDTGSGRRIRVRVGPFAEREQADRTAAKIKAAGLSAAVLTL